MIEPIEPLYRKDIRECIDAKELTNQIYLYTIATAQENATVSKDIYIQSHIEVKEKPHQPQFHIQI